MLDCGAAVRSSASRMPKMGSRRGAARIICRVRLYSPSPPSVMLEREAPLRAPTCPRRRWSGPVALAGDGPRACKLFSPHRDQHIVFCRCVRRTALSHASRAQPSDVHAPALFTFATRVLYGPGWTQRNPFPRTVEAADRSQQLLPAYAGPHVVTGPRLSVEAWRRVVSIRASSSNDGPMLRVQPALTRTVMVLAPARARCPGECAGDE